MPHNRTLSSIFIYLFIYFFLNSSRNASPSKEMTAPKNQKKKKKIASCILEESPETHVPKYFVSLNAKRGKNAKQVRIKVQSEGGKIGWSCRGGHAAESSLTWWCYLLRVIYAGLKRWWITRALPRLSFVFRVSKCSIEAVLNGQPRTLQEEREWERARRNTQSRSWKTGTDTRVASPYVHICRRSPLSTLHLQGNVCPLVHVFVCMFSLRKTEDWRGLKGRPEIFDLNTYFHILVMSEGAPVKRDKACFPACLQVINTLHREVRNPGQEIV